MSTLAPGLYCATVRGVPDTTVLVDVSGYGHDVLTTNWRYRPDDITDARPLIVLDLGDSDFAAKMMIETLCAAQSLVGNSPLDRDKTGYRIAHLGLLIEQIREQTKPPRIPEPGLWGVVVAASRGDHASCYWVHTNHGWLCDCAKTSTWDRLIAPTVIRDGIEATS